ncbi:hypothetical protein CEXT_769711, partial [Caerostris extrusa]
MKKNAQGKEKPRDLPCHHPVSLVNYECIDASPPKRQVIGFLFIALAIRRSSFNRGNKQS